MKIGSLEILNIGGRNLPTKKYFSSTPTDNWLVWLPGQGELGPVDGSQINKVELYDSNKNPVSWTAQAVKGFEFSFNILAIQLPTTFDYWAIQSTAAIYVKETLKASKVGFTGYSLGGRGCWYCLANDTKSYIDFIAPVCGFYDFSSGPISNVRTVPIYGVHGDQDTQMSYAQDVQTAQLYNVGRPTQIINGLVCPCYNLVTVPGIAHVVWPYAYDVTTGKDGLLQWVNNQFGVNQQVSDPMQTMVYDGINLIVTTQNGKKITIKPQSVIL